MIDGIIFDIDGTLWDSTPIVAIAWNKVLDNRDDVAFRASVENIQGVFGKPLPVIATIIFPELPYDEQQKLIDECCDSEHHYLHENPAPLYPGVRETIEKLSKKYPLFIVSNCEDGYIEVLLESTGLKPYFTDWECPGTSGLYKADNIRLVVERNNLKSPVYVGDTQGDKDACTEASVPFVFATYGFGKVDEFAASVASFDELEQVLEDL